MSESYQPEVTGCMVVFENDPETALKAARSFLEQNADGFLVIVDNASQSVIADVLEKKLMSNRCKIIRNKKNDGYGGGNNLGLRFSPASAYHVVFNPDVIFHPGSMREMLRFMEQNTDVGLLSPRVVYPNGRFQPLNKLDPALLDLFLRRFFPDILSKIPVIKKRMDRYMMLDVGYDAVVDVPFLSGCCIMFRKNLLDENDFFDERFFLYFEDADITRRMREKSRAVFFPGASITHVWARMAHARLSFSWIFVKSACKYFQKWGWKLY